MTPRDAPNTFADEAAPLAEDERALEAFDYPREWARIAERPAPVRDEARLLVYDRRTGFVAHRRVRDRPDNYCHYGKLSDERREDCRAGSAPKICGERNHRVMFGIYWRESAFVNGQEGNTYIVAS